jgi:hypothetical protein
VQLPADCVETLLILGDEWGNLPGNVQQPAYDEKSLLREVGELFIR